MQTKRSACYDAHAEEIIGILNQNGYQAYYVGGCVRDALLGKTPHDFDVATDALPAETEALFRAKGYAVIATGIRHGTVSVILEKKPYEVTTFRTDGEYSDRRRPDAVTFVRTLREDLARRDFTINALAYHREEGVLDYFDGAADLDRRVLRCVGCPEARFQEDALRILRALRFAAGLGFAVEPNTARALHACKDLLPAVSAERIRAEFTELLTGDRPADIIREYIDVFGVFLPELLPSVGFRQNSPWHIYDVFEHTMTALEHTPRDLTVRLAVLFHDIGKPQAYTQDGAGVGHFKGHAALSALMAEKILNRLCFDRRTREDVCRLIRHHDDRIPAEAASVKRLIRRMGKENAVRAVLVEAADHAAQNPALVAARRQETQAIGRMIEEFTRPGADCCIRIADLTVNGADVLAAGVPQGKRVGKMLAQILELVTEEKLPNKREALLRYIAVHKNTL